MDKIEKKTELYKQISEDQCCSWIEFTEDNNIVTGKFYGIEASNDKSPIYYCSDLKQLKITPDKIQFVLEKYKYMSKAFGGKRSDPEFLSGQDNIPGLLKFPLNFFGSKSGDTIRLKRVSPIYDSKYDDFVFVRFADN